MCSRDCLREGTHFQPGLLSVMIAHHRHTVSPHLDPNLRADMLAENGLLALIAGYKLFELFESFWPTDCVFTLMIYFVKPPENYYKK